MLRKLKIHNFKSFLNAEFEFQQRHLLIGQNNSGKTNLLLALRFLASTASSPLKECAGRLPGDVPEFCNYATFPRDKMSTFLAEIEVDSDHNALRTRMTYELRTEVITDRTTAPSAPLLVVCREVLTASDSKQNLVLLDNDGCRARVLRLDGSKGASAPSFEEHDAPRDATMLSKLYSKAEYQWALLFQNYLAHVGYFCPSAERVRHGWVGCTDTTGLYVHAGNLAQMLYLMKTQQEGHYRSVLRRVQRVDPELLAINFYVSPEQHVLPHVELRGRSSPTSWASLSDGTLRALSLAYLTEVAETQSDYLSPFAPLYMIEEPENSLFVGHLRAIFDCFESEAPSAQIFFTTHSPYVIDQFDLDLTAITLLEREPTHTVVRPLSSMKASIEANTQAMPLGEQFFREMFK